ncbi:MAG TPA: hypothetical protein VK670_09565, partial [Silvibacterium sp.]|nr:hypothetical protein [Silvibacterium sp.]
AGSFRDNVRGRFTSIVVNCAARRSGLAVNRAETVESNQSLCYATLCFLFVELFCCWALQ